jgi:hypothetical protein
VKILGGHPMLAAAVATAVMQWKYRPRRNKRSK